MTGAVLLDVDGTLVDSNYLQVMAWVRAFRDESIEVDAWTVHRSLGQAGPQLVERVTRARGLRLDDDTTERVLDAHSRRAEESFDLLRAFDGAADLVRAVRHRGARPVLATSASPDSLEHLRGVLGVDEELHAVTSSADVEVSKPEPDLVHVALEAAGVGPEDAVFVGDSVWDALAAARAGIPCVAVLSGGVGEAELRDAGAVEVYDDVADLLAHLDESVLARAWTTGT
ncbi:haloacid dehalogenase [Paraoerskovia sediminicola]|uniref:Haloacid dehalogenase n=1 Tax=Paraoerskovia sediminicola TaxID=1138587 RepID=A0ABM8G129_9CELL|nr:HAD family hydrolase [Paraoerskovia sediminicola]BDZ41781.1 haloacid dehalogenase [Paraoerskovia sediminicola]